MKDVWREVWPLWRRHIMSDLDRNVIRPIVMVVTGAVLFRLGSVTLASFDPEGSTMLTLILLIMLVFTLTACVWGFWGFILLVYRCVIIVPSRLP